MTVKDVIDIMVWGSLAALLLAGLVLLGAILIRLRLITLSDRFSRMMRGALIPAAAATAAIATFSSLYLSEEALFVPCELCWYQRIAMYPLAVLLVLAVVFRDKGIWRYAVPISVIGAAVSIYHHWIQIRPSDAPASCSGGVPCTTRHVYELGFVTVPWMALSGFVLITVLLLVERLSRPKADEPEAVAATAESLPY